MEIVNIRIDERLIHGQVAAMWTGSLKVNRIMVVDDVVVTNDMQKKLLKMACPASCKLSILNAETAANNINIRKYEGDRIFIVVKGPETIKEMVECGLDIKEVNVGNMSSGKNTVQIKKTVNITPEDKTIFDELSEKGIYFYTQMIPSAEPEEFMPLVRKQF